MRGAITGLLLTGALWGLLLLAYVGIELVRGHAPFAMFTWDPAGRYITITIAVVLALGAGVGLASERVQSRRGD